ncbi:transformer-2 protein homolog beta-like, partial [Hyalella azteca]|uniref:Transformer-2 protein homolog beta-like n=1 Tax=Hyalella azteca TaxID=294128 RepID=A0A8B7NQN6_HYAAZ
MASSDHSGSPRSEASPAPQRSRSHTPAPRHRPSRSRSRTPHRRARSSRSGSSASSSSRRNGYAEGRSSARASRRSRSPMSNRRRHVGTRDDPVPNKCLGVFGLSTLTKESQLQDIFDKFGENTVKIVTDAK